MAFFLGALATSVERLSRVSGSTPFALFQPQWRRSFKLEGERLQASRLNHLRMLEPAPGRRER